MHQLYTYLVRDRMAERQREADLLRRVRFVGSSGLRDRSRAPAREPRTGRTAHPD